MAEYEQELEAQQLSSQRRMIVKCKLDARKNNLATACLLANMGARMCAVVCVCVCDMHMHTLSDTHTHHYNVIDM